MFFTSKKIKEYRKEFTKDAFPGVDSINNKTAELYDKQEPIHWATIVPYELGGKDPLWAVDCFKSKKQSEHFHYVTLGFTNLFYDEKHAEDKINGFGFELTFRHLPVREDTDKPIWPVNMLQNLARYVFESKKIFDDYHYISANGPLRFDTDTLITAMVFCTDPEMGEIETPHGHVKFLQIFGITTKEYNDLQEKKYTVKELLEKHKSSNPLLITDLSRK